VRPGAEVVAPDAPARSALCLDRPAIPPRHGGDEPRLLLSGQPGRHGVRDGLGLPRSDLCAYKLKKPVRMEFLDFSTLGRAASPVSRSSRSSASSRQGLARAWVPSSRSPAATVAHTTTLADAMTVFVATPQARSLSPSYEVAVRQHADRGLDTYTNMGSIGDAGSQSSKRCIRGDNPPPRRSAAQAAALL
jgi:hypothetical protein